LGDAAHYTSQKISNIVDACVHKIGR